MKESGSIHPYVSVDQSERIWLSERGKNIDVL